jgi:hypothetical protein
MLTKQSHYFNHVPATTSYTYDGESTGLTYCPGGSQTKSDDSQQLRTMNNANTVPARAYQLLFGCQTRTGQVVLIWSVK